MLTLYYHATPNSLKVAVLLHELDLPFQIVPVDIFKGEQHRPEFLRINPNGKVPALTDGEVTVFDSHAILLHLAEKHGRFLPSEPGPRAETLSWLQFVATGLSPMSGQAIHFLHYAPEDLPYAKTRYGAELERHYRVLDTRLAGREWLAGERYSIADMALYGWAASAGYVFGDRGLADYPNVAHFMSRMNARAAVRAAQALKQEHSFKHELDDETRAALFAAHGKTAGAAA
ncbi:glutathione S-transferase family protein [Rhizobium halophytocola]|uniref:GST-like protein n=1 Tax=Rhizobium halophytocola TaxID=735519 RepID=A0ABS4E5T8_9HYPH|nr:glutathione S-transferase family protein [Rhizobium halophytocola]MBP1853316.1 GST-like protein [Rhizobium halophytocola]